MLTWTWLLLAQNPEVEARLHAELDEVLGGRPPALEDLPRLTYTEKVMRDSMRLYSSIMFGESPLTRAQREMIAVVTSEANDCHY